MKVKLSSLTAKTMSNLDAVCEKAPNFDLRLVVELANAIAACERSPLVPDCFEQLGNAGDHARSLRDEVNSIKNGLPLFLLKSSAAELSELTARLKTCAEFAQKVAQLGSEIQGALRLLSKFDGQVLDLGAHAGAMAAEAEFG